jgi:PTH1 family peptidyl-tRNA hydrolase
MYDIINDAKRRRIGMYVIVGLGNPGKKYAHTRHNVGFDVIDRLSAAYHINVDKLKFKSLIGEGTIGNEKVLLVKPQTFMNLSGEAVMQIVNYYKVPAEKLIVIYDDIDTDFGKLRIRKKGSAGTHNGMKNIIYLLQTDLFPRVRIGIGKPEHGDLKDYVLRRFGKSEETTLDEMLSRAVEATAVIVKEDPDLAMNRFNG